MNERVSKPYGMQTKFDSLELEHESIQTSMTDRNLHKERVWWWNLMAIHTIIGYPVNTFSQYILELS